MHKNTTITHTHTQYQATGLYKLASASIATGLILYDCELQLSNHRSNLKLLFGFVSMHPVFSYTSLQSHVKQEMGSYYNSFVNLRRIVRYDTTSYLYSEFTNFYLRL